MKNDLATKNDLEALKDELLSKLIDKNQHQKDMATLATKEELSQAVANLATKEELKWEINELRREIKQIDERHNQRYDRILVTLDGIVGLIKNGRVEKAATEAAIQRHEKTIDDHETRITQLEEQ